MTDTTAAETTAATIASELAKLPLWQQNIGSVWPELQDHMLQVMARHGDMPKWLDALQRLLSLPINEAERRTQTTDLQLANAANEPRLSAPIGVHGNLSETVLAALQETLRTFHPWRKGPWSFYGLHLDTEWRSDWKWQRLTPFLPDLSGQRVLDVGCGNGYFGWQMLNAGAREVIGIDPTVLFVMQHLAATSLLAPLYPQASHQVVPLTLEDLPPAAPHGSTGGTPQASAFDSVFSMGVLYHRKDPMEHLRALRDQLRPGGTLVLETLVCENEDLRPSGRYARMRNVHLLPTPATVSGWLEQLDFRQTTVCDLNRTQLDEQRSTDWMTFESLREALDPNDLTRTVEGHPAPVRACFVAHFDP